MSQESNKFWTFIGLPVSLVILAAAYYVKVPSARKFIDDHTPYARQFLGRWVNDSPGGEVPDSGSKPPDETVPGLNTTPADAPPTMPGLAPTPPPKPKVYDIQTLAADRAVWPRQVQLLKPTKFPAVVDGKAVGSLVAPPGTTVNLVSIKNGQLGLEYKGGGAWLPPGDTDLSSRVLMH